MEDNNKISSILSTIGSIMFFIALLLIIITFSYQMGMSKSSNEYIPVSDVAEMYINDDGYYTIVIKDVTYVDDKSYNASYGEIMDSIK